MKNLKISTGNSVLVARLYDTETAKKVADSLPVKGNAILWGEEIYFSIPVNTKLEDNARQVLEVGELAFYPPMNALCIFFGPTPVSTDGRPVAADKVNPFGKIEGDISVLRQVRSGDLVVIETKE